MNRNPHVAVVGATGAVGVEMIETLEKRDFPVGKLTLLASPKSAGKKLKFKGQDIAVQALTPESFKGVEIALFSAGSGISKELGPVAAKAGAVVVDNSSAFRMNADVPLVVPEINPGDVKQHKGIIANPNCTTAITLMGLFPLHRAFHATRVIAASYQAVSGAGAKGMSELQTQVAQIEKGQKASVEFFAHQIAFNVIPQIADITSNGYTSEEMKLQNEGRKIMHHPELRATITCVRVPVYRAHSVAVTVDFAKPVSVEAAREMLSKASGVELFDDPSKQQYPMPLFYSGKYNCGVGRLRKDLVFDNGLSFWVCGDQLLKGAALNAVQIAELLLN